MYWNVPETVLKLKRQDRIAWHKNRIEREEPVFQFLDKINTGMTPEELRERLGRIRLLLKRVEGALTLNVSQDFSSSVVQLEEKMRELREVRSRRAAIQTDDFKRMNRATYKPSSELDLLPVLRDNEASLRAEAAELQSAILNTCRKVGADPTKYMLLEKEYPSKKV